MALATGAVLMSVPAYAASPPPGSIKTLKTIYSFQGPPSAPNSLVIGGDRNFYGTTKLGGAAGYGSLYRVDPLGNFLTLHEFGGDSGAYPFVLVQATDGRLYGGSTGLAGQGAVYRIETNGDFQLLHEFTEAEGGSQPVALVATSDGNIYGFSYGGTGYGAFFRILPEGTFTVVRQFQETDEVYVAGMVEASGELYGYGASAGVAAVFHISWQGSLAILHTFPGGLGLQPDRLIVGKDGNVYGTTPGGYSVWHGQVIVDNPGSVFQCTPTGEFRELYSFHIAGDPSPVRYVGAFVQSSSGDLYGIGDNLIYRLPLAGEIAPLYRTGEYNVFSTLTDDIDGNIFGTNWSGGTFGVGALFQIVFGHLGSVNLSSRMNIGTDEHVSIGGFIVTGNAAKKVMVRAIGPSLINQGISGILEDPSLAVYDGSGTVIGRNDDWQTTLIGGIIVADQSAEIQASGIAPVDSRESAIIATLQPGNYTAVASGSNGGTGIGLVEVYDVAIESTAQLANISTRGFVDTGNNVMIGGLILDGSFYGQTNVVFRAIGPSLSQIGISDSLQDPTLAVYNEDGTQFAANDDWRDGQQPEVIALGLAPTDDRESAIYVSLSPGSRYTVIVSGHGGATGVALVEIYNIP
jgi:uncharacterized repeat protein (TIGR03803 family)